MPVNRFRYVIAYDIPDDRRRAGVARALEGHGERVQYSVFECLLQTKQFDALWEELSELVEEGEDSLRVYRLCAACEEWTRTVGRAVAVEVPQVYVV